MKDLYILTCPCCGGRLAIPQDVSASTCVYCGEDYLVRRETGLIYLSPGLEPGREIKKESELTETERVILRLRKENNALLLSEDALLNEKPQNSLGCLTTAYITLSIISIIAFVGGWLMEDHRQYTPLLVGAILLMLAGVLIFSQAFSRRTWDSKVGTRIKAMDAKVAENNAEIERLRNGGDLNQPRVP